MGVCIRENASPMEDKQRYLSAELAPRLAAIDIGTNSLRLIIAEPLRDGNYRVLDDEKETTRLGKQLHATGKLDPAAVQNTIGTLRRMKQIAEGYQVQQMRVIATCAVREAKDGAAFCQRVRDEVGLEIEVISSRKEAHFAFLSVARSFQLHGKHVAVADLGGGSTEIILASGNLVEGIYSTPLGAVRITEMFSAQQNIDDETYLRMTKYIDQELRKHTKGALLHPHLLIGSGGTFTTLADMTMASKRQTGLPLRGYEISHAEVRHLVDRMRKLSARARKSLPGLSSDRADIILAGATIIDRLMRHLDVNLLQIHDRGVRDGLLLTMIDQSVGKSTEDPLDQDVAIDRLAMACGVDLDHCRHVARLAGSLFGQLHADYGLADSDRGLLETAARLQDVGYLINYDKHHKHSFHLILNSRLPGFQPHDLEIIAHVARYHRGSEPRKKHNQFARLSEADQIRVRRLAAILRLAGGLDRSNTRQVQDARISRNGKRTQIHVVSADFPEVDLWAARRRAEPFERAFDTRLSIDWQGEHPAVTTKHAHS